MKGKDMSYEEIIRESQRQAQEHRQIDNEIYQQHLAKQAAQESDSARLGELLDEAEELKLKINERERFAGSEAMFEAVWKDMHQRRLAERTRAVQRRRDNFSI